jgi:hypothetical protein
VKTSDKINELAESLAAAQPKIGIAIKNAVNPHLKNRYADLGAVWDACSEALKSCGLAVVQMPQPSDDGKLHLETILIHKSGQWISGVAVVPIAKQDAQGYGATLTYARRYGLAALLGITQDDDDGERACANKAESEAMDWAEKIAASKDMESLRQTFESAFRANADRSFRSIVTVAKDKRRKELEHGSENP